MKAFDIREQVPELAHLSQSDANQVVEACFKDAPQAQRLRWAVWFLVVMPGVFALSAYFVTGLPWVMLPAAIIGGQIPIVWCRKTLRRLRHEIRLYLEQHKNDL